MLLQVASRDGLLPLHVMLSANRQPSVELARQLLQAHPESLSCWVTDIVPAATGTGNAQGNSSGLLFTLTFIDRVGYLSVHMCRVGLIHSQRRRNCAELYRPGAVSAYAC